MVKTVILCAMLLPSLLTDAAACSFSIPSPEKQFEDSNVVALAVPIGISYRPKAASDPAYPGEFRQTIQWRVVLSWKGELWSGDTFTTRMMHDPLECGSYAPVYRKTHVLIYARGREPYADFHISGQSVWKDHFSFLAGKPTR